MTDIAERLRWYGSTGLERNGPAFTSAMNEAADEIERLRGLLRETKDWINDPSVRIYNRITDVLRAAE